MIKKWTYWSGTRLMKMILTKKVKNLFWKEMKIQIMIHLLQCMLKFKNIKSKILMIITSRTQKYLLQKPVP